MRARDRGHRVVEKGVEDGGGDERVEDGHVDVDHQEGGDEEREHRHHVEQEPWCWVPTTQPT